MSWLNTQLDRACVDVNEFGWLCGWVMECQEKGYITEQQLGFRLAWGDAEGANRLLQMINRREGLGDLLAEGTKLAAERLGGGAAECAIYTGKNASPRGHDHRGRWEEMLDTCTGSTGTLETGPPVFPAGARPARPDQPVRPGAGRAPGRGPERPPELRGLARRVHLHHRARTSRISPAPCRRPPGGSTRATRRCASAGGSARSSAPSTSAAASATSSSGRRGATDRRPWTAPPRARSIGKHWERMLDLWYEGMGYDRATGRPTPETLRTVGLEWMIPAVWGGTGLGGEDGTDRGPLTVHVEVLSWVNRMVGGPGTGEVTVDAAVPRGATVRAVLRAMSERFPELGRALWDPTRPREAGRQHRGARQQRRARPARTTSTARCWTASGSRCSASTWAGSAREAGGRTQ